MKTNLQIAALAVALAALGGCATQQAATPAKAMPAAAAAATALYAVLPESGRIHAFGDEPLEAGSERGTRDAQ